MSEPFLERLSQFTPDASGLDRDALLFAAGLNSARPNRVWKSVSAVLVGAQLLSLACLWPHAGDSRPGAQGFVARHSAPAKSSLDRPFSAEPRQSHVWSVRYEADELTLEDYPAENIVFIDSEPTLRAFGSPPESILN
ncbi:MAG TPA: hypothetical protein VGN42_16140 [Pirellulales bacterium]|jgi:hypothetical protein|nr:hypothetical protein [Pirellulales bacterium]